MPLTDDEFEAIAKPFCRFCQIDTPLRYRSDTAEFVHDLKKGALHTHAICGANKLRKERKAMFDNG